MADDFDSSQGFQPLNVPQDKPRQPGWEGMLDDWLGGQGANHVPQSQWRTMLDNLQTVQNYSPDEDIEGPGEWKSGPRGADLYVAPRQQFRELPEGQRPAIDPNEMMENRGLILPRSEDDEQLEVDPNIRDPQHDPRLRTPEQTGGQRQANWFDYINPIGTAEARGARPPSTHPAVTPAPGETPPADNRIGSTREDGAMWDGSRWVTQQEQAQQARETAAAKTSRKETRRERQDITPPEREAPRGIHWYDAYQKGGWRGLLDNLTTPETGIAPFSTLPTLKRELTEGAKGAYEGAKQVVTGPERAQGAGQAAAGAAQAIFSPWTAAYESAVSQPLENLTGMNKAHTNALLTILGPGGVGMFTRAGDALLPKGLQTAQKLVAPETVSSDAREAANLWKEYTGLAARSSEQSIAKTMQGFDEVAKLDSNAKINIQKYLDGDPTATKPPAELNQFVDDLKGIYKERADAMNKLDKYAQYQFRNEYFPRFWEDPNKAQQFVRAWGQSRAGSTGFTKQRTIPSITDGLNAGLKLKYENPIQATMAYVQNADRVIATEHVLQRAKELGLVKTEDELAQLSQKAQGYANDFVELQGRGPVSGLYAPEGFARVWNNAISGGYQGETGKVMEGWRKATNFSTQMLLAGSQYHAFTMAEAAMSTQLARAIGPDGGTTASRLLKGLGYPLAPITYALRGKSLKEVYLDKSSKAFPFWTSSAMPGVTKQDAEIVDYLTRAGGRMASTRHTGDLDTSAFGDYYSSLTRHMGMQGLTSPWQGAKQIGREYKSLYDQSSVPGFAAKVVPYTLGRAMQTWSKPLFQHYIPLIKNGAAGQMMGDYLKANPLASEAEKLDAARRIVTNVDARFGEMIQDNIFWKKTHKQAAMAAMLSYSWNVGGAKVLGGGARDIGRFTSGQGAWTPEAAYFTAFSMNWAMMNSMYQYIRTGQKPGDTDTPLEDMIAARTGGTKMVKTDAATRQATGQEFQEVPERILVPGLAKEIFSWSEHGAGELVNKLNPAAKAVIDTANNERWYNTDYGALKGPMFQPKDQVSKTMWDMMPTWLGNIVDRMFEGGKPILFQQLGKPQDPRSRISGFERFMGMREAPSQLSDPYHAQKKLDAEQRRYKSMKSQEEKRRRLMEKTKQYGGPQ